MAEKALLSLTLLPATVGRCSLGAGSWSNRVQRFNQICPRFVKMYLYLLKWRGHASLLQKGGFKASYYINQLWGMFGLFSFRWELVEMLWFATDRWDRGFDLVACFTPWLFWGTVLWPGSRPALTRCISRVPVCQWTLLLPCVTRWCVITGCAGGIRVYPCGRCCPRWNGSGTKFKAERYSFLLWWL